MSKETFLIVKIILINLVVGFILMAFLSSKAELPPTPKEWRIKQRVHVKFTNFNDEDKAEAISYIQSAIDPLKLDIKLIFDDNIKRADGLTEGIEIRNTIGTTGACARTSTVNGLDNNNQWAVWKLIRIDTTCYGGQRDGSKVIDGVEYSEDIFWHNNILHEMLHGLFLPHLKSISPMPVPLMKPDTGMQKQLIFTFNDAWNLKRKYSRDKLLNYRRINFRRDVMGKTCHLIKGEKSVSFVIEQQSMLLPYLEKLDKYRKVIK